MLRTVLTFCLATGLALVALILGPVEEGSEPGVEPTPLAGPLPIAIPVVPHADPVLPSKGTVGDPIRLDAALSGSFLLKGSDGELYLVADVTAPARIAGERRPLNLALVIDRSGSMAGPKLENAKDAARHLVRRLTSNDRVTLIAYGSSVSVLGERVAGTPGGKRRLLAAIDGIEDFGGTFISGALEAARKALNPAAHPRSVNRIIFLSDGEANEGITSPRGLRRLAGKLAASGISISSIGVGLDFNEDVMLALADRSGGRYTYLRGSRGLKSVLARELDAAATTVAQEVALTIDPLDGTRVDTVYGYPTVTRGGATTVRLSDLSAGENRRVVIRLVAPTGAVRAHSVARVHLSYLRPTDGFPMSASLTLGLAITQDGARELGGRDLAVHSAAARAIAAQGLTEATILYEKGHADRADRLIRQRLESVILLNNSYIGDAKLGIELRELKATVRFRATPARSDEGKHLRKSLKSMATEMSR